MSRSNISEYAYLLFIALCAVVFIACGDGPGELVFDNPLSQDDKGASGQGSDDDALMVLIPAGEFDLCPDSLIGR